MRARNREINIFNMSLLDILTGMLGAFLFLMLGLLPYYAKVSRNKDMNPAELNQLKEENRNLHDQIALQQQQIADLKKQLDELQKIVKESGGGPLTAEQIQKLMDQLDQMRQQLQTAQNQAQQLQGNNGQLQNQMTQMQQQLDQANKDKEFWKNQQGTLSILSSWDSPDTDIDVLVMSPEGKVYSPKVKDKFAGKDCIYDGDDSHVSTTKYSHEGLLVYLTKSGDYLVFYRVPPNAKLADYGSLRGSVLYNEVISQDKGGMVREDTLGNSRTGWTKPGGYYAWATITYDAAKTSILVKPATGKMPNGIVVPQAIPPPPAPSLPFATPAPATSGVPAASPLPR